MFKIVMDGAGDMPPEWQTEYGIDVIPINIHFGEQTYLQNVDLSSEAFYRLADQGREHPKTSQPSPHQFVTFYRSIAQRGEQILSIHVTRKLSGTLASAQLAAQELAGEIEIIPFDSGVGSAGIGFLCREARLLERSGATIEQILQRLNELRSQIQITLTLDTLEYARRSGRVKTLQAALASLLNVKPVVVLREGALEMAGRVRTRKRALEHIVEMMRERMQARLVNVAIVHARDQSTAQDLLAQVKQALNCHETFIAELSISVAANLGPGTVGIVAYPVKDGIR
ncbi:MAG: DegV family protein [Anaerolineales bacterium]